MLSAPNVFVSRLVLSETLPGRDSTVASKACPSRPPEGNRAPVPRPFLPPRPGTLVVRDPEREAFVQKVRAIDPVFTAGDVEGTLRLLPALMAMGPERRDLSLKKSHYLASLARRSLLRGDPASAVRFLDFADAHVRDDHLTDFLRGERSDFREQAEQARP
jgi:hypothetical protein